MLLMRSAFQDSDPDETTWTFVYEAGDGRRCSWSWTRPRARSAAPGEDDGHANRHAPLGSRPFTRRARGCSRYRWRCSRRARVIGAGRRAGAGEGRARAAAEAKHVTLRFLKENRDFIRARLDLLRQKMVERKGGAEAIDPRYLAYPKMLADAQSARGLRSRPPRSCANASSCSRASRELGDLETRLDEMETFLADQRVRLGVLQQNFTGEQRTALMVVVRGYPGDVAPSEIAVAVEDGAPFRVTLDPEQRDALQRGGVVQVFHGFVEPREQVVQVTLTADAWPSGDSGFITLDPTRDRITFLELDLSTVHRAQGGASVAASTWRHDAEMSSVAG
mgnify:CR=1 FL=1